MEKVPRRTPEIRAEVEGREAHPGRGAEDHVRVDHVRHALAAQQSPLVRSVQDVRYCKQRIVQAFHLPDIYTHRLQPTISKLLLATKELGSVKNVARRYADVNALFSMLPSTQQLTWLPSLDRNPHR